MKRSVKEWGYLTFVNPQTQKEQTKIIKESEFTIGRNRTNDITIQNNLISRTHCIITFENKEWHVHDKSYAGTYVNQLLVDKTQTLVNGDVISLCNLTSFQFYFNTKSPNCKKARIKTLPSNTESGVTCEGKTNEVINDSIQEILDESCQIIEVGIKTTSPTPSQIEFELKKKIADLTKELEDCQKYSKQKEQDFRAEKELLEYRLDINYELTNALKEEVLELKKTLEKERNELEKANTDVFCKDALLEILENELQCPICNEIVVDPIVLNCSHIFCSLCINTWMTRKKQCAVCRAPVKHKQKVRALESLIDKLLERCLPEKLNYRQQVLAERENEAAANTAAAAQTANNQRRGRRRSLERSMEDAAMNALYQVVAVAVNARTTRMLTEDPDFGQPNQQDGGNRARERRAGDAVIEIQDSD